MFGVPQEVLVVLCAFAPLFSRPAWSHARTLAIGAILSTGKRTVISALRVMGLRDEGQFTNFHRVLNRANWSSSPLPYCLSSNASAMADRFFRIIFK
jgi:hypothetical protein